MSLETRAKLACAYSGVAWGLFWFPLRWLNDAGITGPWVGVIFFAVQLVCVVPFLVYRPGTIVSGGSGLMLTGLFAGGAIATYALAVVYTEVIRAMLLFYLTPVWSTLLARAVLKEPITAIRWIAIAIAFAGMLVIFGADIGVPWPSNVGDWLGLTSGVLWAFAAVRLRQDTENGPLELTSSFMFWATVVCLFGALLPLPGGTAAPILDVMLPELVWLFPVLAIVAVPGALAAMWGARFIDPGMVGLLFMTEIIVGTITVAIWAGEPFGWREISGVVLISTGGVLESVRDLMVSRHKSG